jgi:hypothetical protein
VRRRVPCFRLHFQGGNDPPCVPARGVGVHREVFPNGKWKIGGDFLLRNRIAIFLFKSDPDFEIAIAITIPIEKQIRIDRDPILISESGRD